MPATTILLEPSRRESRSARLGRVLARRRAWIFAPLFVAACGIALLRPEPVALEVKIPAALVLVLAYAGRFWATGYRTWVHKSGAARYLMSAGPYAHVRHPLYVANGIAGAAALVVLGRFELLAVYSALYVLATAFIVLREEEALASRFGADHARYRALVPAFCPVPGRRMPRNERQGHFSWQPVASSFEAWKLAGVVVTSIYFVLR